MLKFLKNIFITKKIHVEDKNNLENIKKQEIFHIIKNMKIVDINELDVLSKDSLIEILLVLFLSYKNLICVLDNEHNETNFTTNEKINVVEHIIIEDK
jgi:hypothetical protein